MPPRLKLPAFAAPARHVVLVPDECFFVRSVPLALGEGAADPAGQIELALEALAPFPVAQLYYGYWTRPGLDRALVFAAYRKRFSPEQVAGWVDADLVAPRFAALLGAPAPEPATTWLLATPDALTAVHFGDASGVPTSVQTEPVPGAEPARWTEARDRLLRATGGSRAIVEVPEIEVLPGSPGEGDFSTRGGPVASELPVAQAEILDVRDKAELTALRRARARDRWLWRSLVAGLVILGLCALAEGGLVGMRFWERARLAQVAGQTPVVSQIMTAHNLAARIEELSTRRLRPIEMIDTVTAPLPGSVQFISTRTDGINTLDVQAQTTSLNDLHGYRAALDALPATRTVQLEIGRTNNNVTTFRLIVTFEPNAFGPAVEVTS